LVLPSELRSFPASDAEPGPGSGRSEKPKAAANNHERRSYLRTSSPLDRSRFRRALVVAIVLPFLMVALFCAALLWAVRQVVAADHAVQHSGQIVTQSYQSLALILDMETGVRGYLATESRDFLEPYQRSGARVDAALQALDDLIEEEDIQEEQHVSHIKTSFDEWHKFADDAIHQRRAGATAAAEIDNARGKFLMDNIRDNFASLVASEEERRDNAQISAHNAARFTSRLGILLALAVAAIIVILIGYELFALSRTYETSLTRSDALARELGRREAHFRVLAEAIPQIVWATTRDGTPQYFNQRWFEYTGAPANAEEPWAVRVHPDHLDQTLAAWKQSLSSGAPLVTETKLRDSAGNYRWHLGRALPLRNERGEIARWLGTFTDIDDQKRAEEAMSRLAAIVESSEDAIYSKDLDGQIKSWNRGAEKMYGYSAGEMIGHNVSRLTPPDRLHENVDILELLRRGESIEHIETIRLRKDGSAVDVSMAVSPVRNAAGAIVGASTIARDVTERKRATEALRKTEKLAATGRLAGTMAHEINNPLEAVTHLLYLIDKSSSLDQAARNYTQIAMAEVDRIGHIAKQALGFYREASSPVNVKISELVSNVVELYNAGAQNKGVQLEAQLENDASVKAFPGEMRQVFSNLIVNAVDAVPRGGTVKVRVKHGRDWASRRMGIRVLVSDNGPGIPPDVRPHIFEPFFTTKGERGTGIGLWVSEGVVEKQGGRIRLKSSTGRMHGTTFSVFLPYN
jgi:PAS domain S-box-containing protein